MDGYFFYLVNSVSCDGINCDRSVPCLHKEAINSFFLLRGYEVYICTTKFIHELQSRRERCIYVAIIVIF